MENVIDFLSKNNGDGNGAGYGNGYGTDYGNGYGDGNGAGYGYDYGNGAGAGYGDGNGAGMSLKKIQSINNYEIYNIDGIPTIITNLVKNIAKGYIVQGDLNLQPCYIAKIGNCFAHGKTIKEAVQCANDKMYSDMDADEAIELFLEQFNLQDKYLAKDFYIWHNRLTGSCEMGRNHFVEEHNIDLEHDKFTVQEFIERTKNEYGKDVIRQLEREIKELYK